MSSKSLCACKLYIRIVNQTKSSRLVSYRLCSNSVPGKDKTEYDRCLIDRIVRVDHAGELGADSIYAGQMFVLGKSEVGPVIKEMWDQEKHHLATFEKLIPKYRVRPSLLTPLWNITGFALGAGSALFGKEAAMACTVAVEEVIGEHYNDQLRELMASGGKERHGELMEVIREFRDDELHHLQTGLEHDAEQTPGYTVVTDVIKFGCRGAIWLAERI